MTWMAFPLSFAWRAAAATCRWDSPVDHYVNGLHTRTFSKNRRGVVTYEYNYVISRGPFLNDQPHGEWTYRYPNGFTAEGAYEHGERIGAWTVRDPEGKLTTVDYEHGQQ